MIDGVGLAQILDRLAGRPGVSPQGARVEMETSLKTREFHVISGDSFMCQHPNQVHTGLEAGEEVRQLRVLWPDGSKTVVEAPAIPEWHRIAGSR